MRLPFVVFALLLLAACHRPDPTQWHTLDFGAFMVKTPATWEKLILKGIDSYVGGMTDGEDTLMFDYGAYSPMVGREDPENHLFKTDTINGVEADLVIPAQPGKGKAGLSIYRVPGTSSGFALIGGNIQNTDLILQIFRSLRFPSSDTTQHSLLTSADFKPGGKLTSTLQLVRQQCGTCHKMRGYLVGKDFTTIVNTRTPEWIHTLLTHPEQLEQDTTFQRLTQNGQPLPLDLRFHPRLSEQEATRIIQYLQTGLVYGPPASNIVVCRMPSSERGFRSTWFWRTCIRPWTGS